MKERTKPVQAAPEAETSQPDAGRGNLLLLGLLTAFGPLSLDLYLPALPIVAADLSATESLAQLTLSACMVGLAIGQVIAGTLSDRVGRKIPLVVALAVYVGLSLGCTVVSSVETMIALRLLQGAAGGACMVIARAIVRDVYGPTNSARAFSILMLAAGVAPVAAPVLGSQLLLATSWRGLFAVLAILVSGLLLAAILRIKETLPKEERHTGGFARWLSQSRLVFSDPVFIMAGIIQCLMGAAMFTFIAMSSFVFQSQYEFDAQAFGWMFAVISLGIVLFSRISAWAAGRATPTQVTGWGVVISMVGATGLLLSVTLDAVSWVVVIWLFVCIASGGLISPNCYALALREQGQRSGTASGILGLARFGLGAVMGPVVSLAGATALSMGVGMFILTALMAAVYWFAIVWIRSF